MMDADIWTVGAVIQIATLCIISTAWFLTDRSYIH